MAEHSPVTGFASDPHFRHGRSIAIGLRLIMLSHARIVTAGAHRIPCHSSAGPMAPLARMPVLGAKNIEPVLQAGSESQFGRLPSATNPRNQELPQRFYPEDAHRIKRLPLLIGADCEKLAGLICQKRLRIL